MKKKGFTLIELLAVIVILAIVSLIATPVVLNVMEKARRNSFQNSAYGVIKAGELYQTLNDVIPEEGISIFDASFELSNKSQFKSGLIKINGNEIILENVGTSSYCANGTTTNLKVTKGDCSTVDTTVPVIKEIVSNLITSNSITVLVSAEDLESGINEYYYSIDNGANYIKGNNNTYTFSGLKRNTEYSIKVKVVNGNKLETVSETKVIRTLNVEVPTYSINNSNPTKDNVIVTITYPSKKETGWKYEYKKDNNNWVEVVSGSTKTVEFSSNGSVIARIIDTTNEVNNVEASIFEVSNIDKEGPIISSFGSNLITSSSVTLVTNSSDINNIKGYYYSKDGGTTYTAIQSSNTYTFTGLSKNTSYNFKVKVEDNVGNVTESNVLAGKTTNIELPTYSASTTSVTNRNVVVTITYPSSKESNWEYQYVKDGITTVVTGNSTTVTFTANGSVTAKIVDKGNSNNTVTASTYNVNNIDKEGPSITGFVINSITSSTITLVTTATDSQGIKGYYYSKDNGATYTSIQNTNTYTFTNLNKNTSYNFKVKVEDNVGNISESNVVTGKTTNITTPSYSANIITPTNQDVIVTINYPSSKETNWEYQYIKDGTTTVVSGSSTTVTFTGNGSVTAKIVDTGNSNNTVTASTISISPTSVTIYSGDNYSLMTGVTTGDTGGSGVASTTIKEGSTTISSTTGLSVGTHTLTYTVIDVAGNSATANRTIIVKSKVLYQESTLNGAYPEIGTGMIPIIIDNNGTVKKADIYSEWYSYASKKWANAVTVTSESRSKYTSAAAGTVIAEADILTYLVWIPRYKYQLWNVNGDSSGSKTGPFQISVVFENKSTAKSTGTTNGSWLTHPSFTFGEEINGYWVGKFETGYSGATSTTGAEVNSNDPSKVVIKPNTYSWRNITISNMFSTVQGMKNSGNIFGLSTSSDSHMMKNSEWGAVAYLSHSQYGTNKQVRINNNSQYVTGCAASAEDGASYAGCENAWNTATGYLASTTGNIYGVYDMSGGAWEYVMGYTTGASTQYGSSGFTSSNFPASKYVDIYTATSETQYSDGHLGDATKEVGPFSIYRSSWYQDYARFVRSDSPWFVRGGYYYSATSAGAFSFSFNFRGTLEWISFRVVVLGQ